MVPEEEALPEDDLDGSVMAEDKEISHSDVGVSSTAVSLEPIPIPAPVRASIHTQQVVKGRGTKDHPYDLDFTPAVHRGHGVPPETHHKQRDCRRISTRLSPCYSLGIGFASCRARNVEG